MTEQFTFFFQNSSPFSQFHPAKFTVNDIEYSCAEQYMMHQKAVLFHDPEIAAEILQATEPKVIKALGRKVRNFNQDVWEQNCRKIVHDGNYAKFSQNESLRSALFATEGTTLVEASPFDTIWGVGLSDSDPAIRDRQTWKGENRLGQILTEVRDRLLAEARAA
jgi:ribA/ribD-fused uncharacterized protein